MTKQIKLMTVMASAIMGFAACSSDKLEAYQGQPDTNLESPSNAISFGTYMGKTGTTRAGAEGTITSAQLLAQKQGFGVFGYYTGASTYNEVQYDNGSATTANYQDQLANFMFNQQITGTNEATPAWSYTPIKYWPNEVQSGAVDDQTDPATSTGTYGGKVSFFAYAPYTGFPITPTTDGIVAINGNTALATANAVTGDPTVTYTIPTDLNAGGDFVDLLWGTLNGTSENVLGTAQNGVDGTKTSSSANPVKPTSGTYAANVLDDYFTNADLTKQKTAGTVGFKFIHALSKIGGGSTGDSPTTGLLVKLDIDNNGSESGGTREKYDATGDSDTDDDDDLWRTIVTVKSVTITNDLNGNDAATDAGEVGIGGTRTLNLATGCWSEDAVTTLYKQTIGTTTTTPAFTPDAVLNTKIAEIYDAKPTTWLSHLTSANYFKNSNAASNSSTHPGVTETPQSVYNNSNQSPIILFPGTTPKFKITIDYIVRTHDPNLSAGYSEVEQVITKTITFTQAVKMNKHYSILMHLGLTGVKFTATVDSWNTDIDGDSDTDANDAQQVDLPINVQ